MDDRVPPTPENVIPIKQKRAEKRKAQGDSDKIPEGTRYRMLAEAMNAEIFSPLPEFKVKFNLIEVAKDLFEPATIADDGIVTLVTKNTVFSAIMDYCHGPLAGMPEFSLTPKRCAEAYRTWELATEPKPTPKTVRFKSESGLCWQRLTFDLEEDYEAAKTPSWDTLFNGIANEDARSAVKAWIWSLFVPESYCQEYVWIHGPGQNGKGCLSRFLYKIMDKSAQFLSVIPPKPNQFWTRQFINKRLVVAPDCENRDLPASGLFKSMTGGDPQGIEVKWGGFHNAVFNAKWLFTGQELPNISSEKSDKRRAIFARMETIHKWTSGFEDKLWAEGGAFLWDCMKTYEERCPNHGPIAALNHDLEDWVSTLEENFQVAFDQNFRVEEGAVVEPRVMQEILNREFDTRAQRLSFTNWIERTYGVRKRSIRVAGNANPTKGYLGMAPREAGTVLPVSHFDPQM